MSKFRILHDFVLIKKNPRPVKTEGGIYLTPSNIGAKGAPMEGIVVAVGPGKTLIGKNGQIEKIVPDVLPGDQIIFGQTDLKVIKQLDENFVIVPSSEVLLRLRPDEPVIPEGPTFK